MVGIEDRRFFHSSDAAVEDCEPVLYSCSDFNLIQHVLLNNALKEMLFPSAKLFLARSHTTHNTDVSKISCETCLWVTY